MKLPLSTLFIKLEHAGLKLSPAEQLNIQEVLHKLGSKYLNQPAQIERILGPVIAKNETEQDIFRQTFQEYWKSIQAEPVPELVSEAIPDKNHIQERLNKKRKFLYPLAALTFATILILILGFPFQVQKKVSETPVSENTLLPKFDQGSKDINEKASKDHLELYGEKTNKILDPPQQSLSFELGHGPRHVVAGEKFDFLLEANQNLNELDIAWDFGDGNISSQAKPSHTYSNPGLYTVEVKIKDEYDSPSTDTYLVEYLTFPVYPVGTSFTSVVASDIARQETTQNRIKWQVFFLAFFMIMAIEGYLEKYKQKQYRLAFHQYFHRGENAPYTLPYADIHEQLQAEPGLYSLAESLKKRRVSKVMGLDVKSSLYETVQAGGFPQLVYSTEKASSEYLVLIDESGPSDHQAMLFDQFINLLKKEEVLIESFRFRNDPRICYNDEYPEGIDLDLISRRIQADRLLIFGKGSFFLDLKTHKLADWTEEAFSPWQQKVLLTPEPVLSWGFRERALQKSFQVLAADLKAQQGILEALLADDFQDFESLQEEALVSNNSTTPLAAYNFEDKEDLQAYLGDALYKWLMASMVSSKPSWAMTLKVGKALDEQSAVVLEGRKLVSYDNLLKLSRIPWLQQGACPPELQEELVRDLDEETEQIARHAVLDLLKQTEVPENSLAYQEKLIEQTVQQSALAPENKDLQQKLRFLWQNNMLNQSMRGLLSEDFGHRITDFFFRHQRALAPAFIGTLLLATMAFAGVGISKHSDRALLEKHFEQFPSSPSLGVTDFATPFSSQMPVDILGSMSQAELFERGINKLDKGQYQSALEAFDLLKIDGFGYEVQQWYMALAYIGNGQENKAKKLLIDIQKDPNNLYYFKAIDLLNDLDSFWRF